MGFLKEFALAQKLICRLWGTVAAGSRCQPLMVRAHVEKSLLTKGCNVHQLVVMIGASLRDGIHRVRRLDKEAAAANLHYERSVLRHVPSAFYIDTGIEGRKGPFGDLPKDDIDNHEIHWWRSRVTEAKRRICGLIS